MRRNLYIAVVLVALIFIWENTASVSPDVSFFISSPSECIKFAAERFRPLCVSTLITATEAAVGCITAVALSVAFFLLCLYWPKFLTVALPIFVSSQIIPLITLAPLFIILFGMGLLSKIAMVVLMCFFPIFINLAAGVATVPPNIIELLYIYNTGRAFRIFQVIIPLSLPSGFVGLKISTTMALMGAIVAEFTGARDGLGKNLYLAPKSSQPQLMVCSTAIIIVLGFIFYYLIVIIDKLTCRWHKPDEKLSL